MVHYFIYRQGFGEACSGQNGKRRGLGLQGIRPPHMGRPEIVKVSPAVGSFWSRHLFTRSLINDSNVNIISLCGRRSACVRAHVLARVCTCTAHNRRSTALLYRSLASCQVLWNMRLVGVCFNIALFRLWSGRSVIV